MTRVFLSLLLVFALASTHAITVLDKSEAPLIVAASTAVVSPAETAQHAPIASDGLRSGLVELDLRSMLIDSADGVERFWLAPAVRLQLFPDVVVDGVGERIEDAVGGASSWIGSLSGERTGQIVLTVANQQLVARIDVGLDQYVLMTNEDGRTWVTQVDPASFFERNAREPTDEPGTAALQDNFVIAHPPAAPQSMAGAGRTVDILVLYTTSAKGTMGEPAAFINSLVADANQSLINSSVDGAWRVVGYHELTSYTEPTSDDPEHYRKHTTEKMRDGAGEFAEVPGLRDDHAADGVVLFVDGSKLNGTCGYGLLKGSHADWGDSAFATVSSTCGFGDRTFTHELGHTMGGMHNYPQAPGDFGETGPSLYGFSRGYWSASPFFRTIMAHGPDCTVSNCARINRWSSPYQTYLGLPVGTSTPKTDMVSSLDLTFPGFAQYRTPSGLSSPGAVNHMESCSNGSSTGLVWSPGAGTSHWNEVEQSSSAVFTTADQIYRGSASHIRTHFWETTHVRARSCNAAGCGGWSMPISVPPTSWGICN